MVKCTLNFTRWVLLSYAAESNINLNCVIERAFDCTLYVYDIQTMIYEMIHEYYFTLQIGRLKL